MPEELRKLCQAEAENSINVIIAIRDAKKINPDIRRRAANDLLDRGYGKPAQPVGGTDALPAIRIIRDVIKEAADG